MPKRALVVDDSRVARVTLGKFLVEYKLAVDMAESAESALQYLASNPPPHVIFMDHMMPGMDGLQAVVAIKKNPDTAKIPIVMYTSKDGDLYMGQARSLGAVGVLSKPINPVELQKIIQGLNLATDAGATPAAASALEENLSADIKPKANYATQDIDLDDFISDKQQSGDDITFLVKRLFDEQRTKLKQDLQVHSELLVRKVIERLQTSDVMSVAKPMQHKSAPWSVKIISFAVVIGLLSVIAFFYFDSHDKIVPPKIASVNSAAPGENNDPEVENNKPMTLPEPNRNETSPRSVAENQTVINEDKSKFSDTPEKHRPKSTEDRNKLIKTIEWMANMNSGFNFDQTPLNEERLALVSELVSRLSLIDFKGTLRLSVHNGDFCLVRSESGVFKLPSEDAPIQNCQLLSLPQEQLLPPRQTPAFGRFLAAAPYNNGNLRIEVISYGKEQPSYKYPSFSTVRTAGEWNRIAGQNNRVEILILPTAP